MKKAKHLLMGCVCLMLSATPVLAMQSTDIKQSAWYDDAVQYVEGKGIMKGLTEATFGPNEMMTRGAFILSIYHLANDPEVKGVSSFQDVNKDADYAEAVVWGVKNKIVSGYSQTEFRPDAPITREEMVTIFYKYTQYRGIETPIEGMSIREYVDEQGVSKWARNPMCWGIGAGGIVYGTGEQQLMPQAKATRAEAATMLMRYSERKLQE